MFKKILLCVALCAVAETLAKNPHQGEIVHGPPHGHHSIFEDNKPHKFNGNIRQENENVEEEELKDVLEENAIEVPAEIDITSKASLGYVYCDYQVIPRETCYDCYTRVKCEEKKGGKLKLCVDPLKPYCYNGVCSAIATAQCQPTTTTNSDNN